MDPRRTLGFLLKDVSRLYTRRFEARAEELQLTLAQCKALLYLARNEGVSQKRLAELIEIDPMSLVRILDRMEADGWVERGSDPVDRRARCLAVTEKAKPIVERIWSLVGETRAEALEGLTPDERQTLVDLLERVHQNLLTLKALADAGESKSAGASARKSGSDDP